MKYDKQLVVSIYLDNGINLVPEYQFAPPRLWRFDFADPESMTAIEVDGGLFVGGRHSTGAGIVKDMEKLNHAVLRGWKVLRFQPIDLCMEDTIEMVKEAIKL